MNKPNWKYFKNAEFIQFHSRSLALITAYDLESLGLHEQEQGWRSKHQELFDLHDRSMRTSLSNEIVEQNKVRGKACRLIRKTLEAYATHFVKEQRDASQVLLSLFQDFEKNIERLPYAEKTLAINKVYDQAKESLVYKTAVETLQMAGWFEHLKATNTEFERLYLRRTRINAGLETNSLGARIELVAFYNNFMKHLNAHYTLRPSVALAKMVEDMDELVKKTNLSSKLRKNRRREERMFPNAFVCDSLSLIQNMRLNYN